MGLFKHLRGKSRNKDTGPVGAAPYTYSTYTPHTNDGRNHIAKIPPPVLGRILTFVCPHVQDRSYETCENSQIGDGCMLCDLRDLASCALVNHRWYQLAQHLLYTSIRIDAVHYCSLEEELADRRKKAAKHFRKKTLVDPGDIPGIRLGLLCRTVRANVGLAHRVQFLKLPYMTREACKTDLAQTISVLSNLRYVDLPDGFYTGDTSCMLLKQELQAQCPNIRKMSYLSGSEQEIEYLAQGLWQELTVLDIRGLHLELVALRLVLAGLPHLQDLTLADMSWLDDTLFEHNAMCPDHPPVRRLRLENVPNITANGLQHYLSEPYIRDRLQLLSLQSTGVTVSELQPVLWNASALISLAITEKVSKSLLFTEDMAPLSSLSLRTLNFEISSADDGFPGRQNPADSYYTYLASSLHASALPALAVLYVRDSAFPERLLVPPTPQGPVRGHHPNGSVSSIAGNTLSMYAPAFLSQGSRFNQTLEVYSKGIDELEWVMTAITPPSQTRDRRGSASNARPISAISASRGLGPQWAHGGFGGEVRQSVVVGNGFGGFLAVPANEVPSAMIDDNMRAAARNSAMYDSDDDRLRPPPNMATLTGSPKVIAKRGSKHDLWR